MGGGSSPRREDNHHANIPCLEPFCSSVKWLFLENEITECETTPRTRKKAQQMATVTIAIGPQPPGAAGTCRGAGSTWQTPRASVGGSADFSACPWGAWRDERYPGAVGREMGRGACGQAGLSLQASVRERVSRTVCVIETLVLPPHSPGWTLWLSTTHPASASLCTAPLTACHRLHILILRDYCKSPPHSPTPVSPLPWSLCSSRCP